MKKTTNCVVLGLLTVLLSAVTSAAQQTPNTLTDQELADGWILLFDGETTFGWKPSSDADWTVVDGAISASRGGPGLLCTTSRFADYDLKVDCRTTLGANSGVFLHTIPNPIRADLTTKCYEVNISGEAQDEWPTGSLVDRQKPRKTSRESDEDRVINQRREMVKQRYSPAFDPRDNRWHTLDISIRGGRVQVKLDGRETADYVDPKPLDKGPIGLQFRTGKVEFRNIKLRPADMKSIFNGKNLSGWTQYPGMASVFSVTPEGYLRIQNGKGQLETAGQYTDFTLQMEIYVNGRGLNSGVFFRCIPGEFWMGYESQIQNAFKENDRTKPADCGTGGIFRRQAARKVVADDFVWFYKTIHADGPHIAAWVNGYQVSDWTDTRKADKNPRKGLRLEAGTIAIQGHDPTTDFKFRNLKIAQE